MTDAYAERSPTPRLGRGEGEGPLPGERFDAVIVGAGAAGLSLACHLADVGWGNKVLLVDDGSHPVDQRSWAWWTAGGGLLDAAASLAFDRQWVAGPGWRRSMPLDPYTYRSITGPELTAAADRIMGVRRGYVRAAGTVREVAEEDAGCRVTIDLPWPGGPRTVDVSARWVFDGVGVNSSPAAQLDFLGLHIECTDDTFDQGAVTLMDFRTDQSDGVSFMYVLPTSPRSALVERTTFVVAGAGSSTAVGSRHEEHVREYLRTHLGAHRFEVARCEIGAIPLELRPPAAAAGSVIPIGARAGMVKASTGYGFARIQRHSEAIALRLSQGRSPANAVPLRRWSRALDGALLRVIRDEPASAVEIFAALLTRNPAARILAFLDEEASLRSQFHLFATLPLAPFARAMMRGATRGLFPAARAKR